LNSTKEEYEFIESICLNENARKISDNFIQIMNRMGEYVGRSETLNFLKAVMEYYQNETFFYSNDFKIVVEILHRDLIELVEENIIIEYLNIIAILTNSKIYHENDFHLKEDFIKHIDKVIEKLESQNYNISNNELLKTAEKTKRFILKKEYKIREKKYDITKDSDQKFKVKVKKEEKKKIKKKGKK
jgi:hypothetical protein